MELTVNNISTIATTVWVSIIAPILISLGISIDQSLGVGVLTAILTILFMIWNAKNPNTFFENTSVTSDNGVLNDEYVTGDVDEF